jgi:hypothetical protein
MKRIVLASAAVIAIVATAVACEDNERYVYTARRFDEANACVDSTYTAVELVDGEGADPKCPPTCLTFKQVFYVSPVCPPLPVDVTEVDQSDPVCQAAVAAFKAETLCDAPAEEEDGGDEGGAEETDGGGGEDAAEEI